MADMSIKINIDGDSAGGVRSIKAVTTALGGIRTASLGASGGIGKLISGLGAFGLAAQGVGVLTRAIEGLGKAMVAPIKSASDLSESVSKVGVIFGQSSKAVTDFAATAAASLGQSRNQALEATGAFGNLFRTMGLGERSSADMSISLVKLASDLASFNNEDPTDVLTALRSGLVGETEPLRRFGILLNEATVTNQALRMGLAKTAADLTESQKVQARYALILGQTGAAQGDFARTSSGMANSIRIIQAHFQDIATIIGEEVLPVITPLIAEFAQKLPAMIQQARPHIRAFGEAVRYGAELAVGGLQALWQSFTSVFGGIVEVAQAAGRLVYEAMSWLNPYATHSPSLVSQVEDGLGEITTLYASLPTAINPHLAAVGAAQGEMKDQIAASERALQAGERALRPYERALASLQKTVGHLGDELSDAQSALSRFQNAPLAGERAFDDRIFNAGQDQARLRLEQLDMEEAGPGRGAAARRAFAARRRALEAQLRGADRAGERARLERQLSIDPQRRALDAIGRGPEMTFAAALKGAQEAYATIQRIEPVYERAREETEKMADALAEQRDRLAEQRDLLAEIKSGYEAANAAAGKGIGGAFTPPKFALPGMGGPPNPDDGPREMSPAAKAIFQFQMKLKEITDAVNGATKGVKEFLDEIGGDNPGKAIEKWGKSFTDWIGPLLEPMKDKARHLIADFADWIGGDAQKNAIKEGTAGYTEALLAWLGNTGLAFGKGLMGATDDWKKEMKNPNVAMALGSIGGDIAASILNGLSVGFSKAGLAFRKWIVEEWAPDTARAIEEGLRNALKVPQFGGAPQVPLPRTPPPAIGGGGGGHLRARGGPVRAGQAYWVGEEGPEMVVPRRDGYVMTAAQSAAANGGGSVQITVNVGPVDVRETADIQRIADAVEDRLGQAWDRATGRGTRRPLGLARSTT